MMICIFTETYHPVMGGGETQARLLAEGLAVRGHSVLILTRRSDTALQTYERFGGVSVHRLSPIGKGYLKKWGLLISGFAKLIQLREQYDLIFVAGYRIIGMTAVLAGKLLGKPVILKADSQGEMSGEYFTGGLRKFGASPSSSFFKLFLVFRNSILKKADAFSAISTDITSEWALSGIPSGKIHLIPNCVDTNHFIPVEPGQKLWLREKLNLPRDRFIAIYTGRLVSYKGLPLLLRVWNELLNEHQNILLVLVGIGGLDIHNCERELHQYVTSHQLEKYIFFTGVVQNVPEYLQASDIFVFPTENEAFGASVVEAMACALPVIATTVGALKSIITHEENGILIQPGDHEQLLDSLHVMISNAERSLPLGHAARLTVLDQYSAEGSTGKYLSLFQSILHSR
jgi:glycosyltransferase involved in cell wall biosynthesis